MYFLGNGIKSVWAWHPCINEQCSIIIPLCLTFSDDEEHLAPIITSVLPMYDVITKSASRFIIEVFRIIPSTNAATRLRYFLFIGPKAPAERNPKTNTHIFRHKYKAYNRRRGNSPHHAIYGSIIVLFLLSRLFFSWEWDALGT